MDRLLVDLDAVIKHAVPTEAIFLKDCYRTLNTNQAAYQPYLAVIRATVNPLLDSCTEANIADLYDLLFGPYRITYGQSTRPTKSKTD